MWWHLRRFCFGYSSISGMESNTSKDYIRMRYNTCERKTVFRAITLKHPLSRPFWPVQTPWPYLHPFISFLLHILFRWVLVLSDYFVCFKDLTLRCYSALLLHLCLPYFLLTTDNEILQKTIDQPDMYKILIDSLFIIH